MDLTLRQLQRMLHASKKNPGALIGEGLSDIASLGNAVCGHPLFAHAALQNDRVVNVCPCCNLKPVSSISSFVDALCRKHGPKTTLKEVLRAAQQQNQNGAQAAGDGEESDEDNEDSEQQPCQSGGDGTSSRNPKPQQSPEDAAANWEIDERIRQAREERQKARDAEAAKAKAAQAEAAAKALEAAKQALQKAKATKQPITLAQRVLKNARRAVSFDQAAAVAAPSLVARRHLANANGRLRAVPPRLRTQMAELINRLMGNSGNSGGNVSPIPVYDSRKLVKRMLVKRPLPNALKEDVITGRPVTLFLPDVSPSCALQAQAACDIANAAGYAGVSGSDVLVLPHSNGCVEEHDDSYIPWFNGKPVTMQRAEWARLFREITEGRSTYKIRVVIAVGDHDAEEMYAQIAALKSVVRLVWLHNGGEQRRGPYIDREKDSLYSWSVEARNKTSFVWNCTKQTQMIRGLDLVLR